MASSAAASRRLAQTWHSLRTGSAAASVEELPELKFEVREDNVAVITLNNPEQLNPMGETMLQSFHQALQKVENPKSGIRALLITGAGRAFCSGANLTAGGGGDGGPPQAFSNVPGAPAAASLEAMYNPIISRLRDLRVPIVAAVNGPCAGVGMSFAMVADIVIANESAFFLQAFRNIGLVPDGGATFMLPRLVGWGRAMEMAMMGGRVQADKALEWGLVNEVHSDDTMVDVAIEKAADLAAGPTQTLALIRQMYWASTRVRPRTPAAGPLRAHPIAGLTFCGSCLRQNTLEEQLACATVSLILILHHLSPSFAVVDLRLENKNQAVAGSSADAREGRLAFVEKRTAVFTGGAAVAEATAEDE